MGENLHIPNIVKIGGSLWHKNKENRGVPGSQPEISALNAARMIRNDRLASFVQLASDCALLCATVRPGARTSKEKCTRLAFSRMHFQSQLGSAIETIISKWGITGHFGAWRASCDQNFKEPAMQISRGENECLYHYRARCAPGLPTAQHLFAKPHWRVGIDENHFSGERFLSLGALHICAPSAQRFGPD